MHRKVLVLTDNAVIFAAFRRIVAGLDLSTCAVTYARTGAADRDSPLFALPVIDPKVHVKSLTDSYDLIISAHCKKLFPAELVGAVKCINVHPGFNPFNRGWYPQAFSILNGMPLGATIHEMDEALDHGPIIAREQVPVYEWDTSLSAYERVLAKETELVEANLAAILSGKYSTAPPEAEGNLNRRADFAALCRLDLADRMTARELIDRLRALSHGEYRNAYFLTDTGRRVYLRVVLTVEPPSSE